MAQNALPEKLPVISILCFKWDEEKPIKVAEVYNLDDFSFFQKGTIKEACLFGSRLLAARTPRGSAVTVTGTANEEKGPGPLDDYITHVKVRGSDQLAITVITAKQYPPRIALKLMLDLESEWDKLQNQTWKSALQDTAIPFPAGEQLIKRFSNPKQNDKIYQIQDQLEQTKDIMVRNIEQVLRRGEKIDSLVEKSDELSGFTKTFYNNSQKLNSCCNIL